MALELVSKSETSDITEYRVWCVYMQHTIMSMDIRLVTIRTSEDKANAFARIAQAGAEDWKYFVAEEQLLDGADVI